MTIFKHLLRVLNVPEGVDSRVPGKSEDMVKIGDLPCRIHV